MNGEKNMSEPKPESGEFSEIDAEDQAVLMGHYQSELSKGVMKIDATPFVEGARWQHSRTARQVEELREDADYWKRTRSMDLAAANDYITKLKAQAERLADALTPFAKIKDDDGDTFEGYDADIILRVEIVAGELHRARTALQQYRDGGRES